MEKRSKQNAYPGYKELIGTEFIQPLIQEVEKKRQHVMACTVEAEKTVSWLSQQEHPNVFKSTSDVQLLHY